MKTADSLTISGRQPALRRSRRTLRPVACVPAVLGMMLLGVTACTVEVGPPPESDPPLVPESAKAPPPPQQPTEPQAWSRDLDFEAGPARLERGELAEGLVASSGEGHYSSERLTYESALTAERPLSEAELALKRARERAAAAGTPVPPAASAAPVAEVSAESLPPLGETAAGSAVAEKAAAPRRPSRLPPPPKFPPLPAKAEAAEAEATTVAQQEAALPAPEPVSDRAPEASDAEAAEPVKQAMADETAMSVTAFSAAAWDAPAGTILVQVSAVQKEDKVVGEWQRLQARYRQVLQPLRLVVEEAKLGDRGVFYRLQAGAFGTEAAASAACDALIDAGQACFVVVR